MGSRRKAREIALQVIYLVDIAKMHPQKAFTGVKMGHKLDKNTLEFAKSLFDGIGSNRNKLDDLIKKYAENWDIDRMAALDRNILRMGAYEFLYEIDTPVSVIIDEAVEIAKMFSTEESGKFVNGILDKIKLERKESTSSQK